MADEQLTEEQKAEAAKTAEAVNKEIPAVEQSVSKGPDGWIPKVRLDEVLAENRATKELLQKERDERIRLEERVKPQEQKAPTRAELLQGVETGQITQAQADEAWEKQIEHRVRTGITEEWKQYESTRDLTTRVTTEMDQYTQTYPDVMTHGTENRDKVAAEFSYLRSHGMPDTKATELIALRNVFGPIHKKRDITQQRRETHQETSGEKPGGENQKTPELPTRYKTYYQSQIDKGMYKGWDDPGLQRELKRVPNETLSARAKKYS